MELKINEKFGQLAGKESVGRARISMEKNNVRVFYAEDADEAKKIALKLIPKGAEIMNMTSMTLSQIGLDKEILESGNYKPVRKELETLQDDKRKKELGAAPDYAIGSIHALTEAGEIMIASATGSQLAAYAYGANNIIWVIGAQKIVKDKDEGMKRIYDYSLPLENERAKKAYGAGSAVNKMLVINKEVKPERISVILVNEKLGF